MTVDDLRERWGCTEATIYAHIRAGRLDCLDVSPGGIDWTKRGPKQVAFTLAQVEDFERRQTRTFRTEAIDADTPPVETVRGPGLVRVPKRRGRAKA